MFTIRCPNCSTDTNLAFGESSYSGPLRCWKCKEAFTVTIKDGELVSYEIMSEVKLEEFDRFFY